MLDIGMLAGETQWKAAESEMNNPIIPAYGYNPAKASFLTCKLSNVAEQHTHTFAPKLMSAIPAGSYS